MSNESESSYSPDNTRTAPQLRTERRTIDSLPHRPKSSTGHPETPSEASTYDVLTPESSLGNSLSPQSPSSHGDLGIDSNGIADAGHLSPPRTSSSQAPIQFGSDHGATSLHEVFTFRSLHNVTPKPPYWGSKERPQFGNAQFSEQKIAVERTEAIPEPVETILAPSALADGISSTIRDPALLSMPLFCCAPAAELSASPIRPSYDVRDEASPPTPFFRPVFQTALQSGLQVAKDIVAVIGSVLDNFGSRSDLQKLLEDAKRLSTFDTSDTRTIAVLGDSGQGKSSLINSLLHFPEIAKTGDIGAACTSVVTEYRYKTKDHTSPITIEVEYLSESAIDELIKELLWNFRQLYIPEIEDDKFDAKEYQRIQRESEQAWSALEAAFKHQRSFSKELLEDMSDGALETITQRLIEWAREIEWPEGQTNGKWKSTAETAEECCEKTSIFMENRLWPFTKIIRVYLSAQVLKTGIVLADLPGLQDTNLARVRATQTYLMKCDYVFVVANISRAITDQSLKSSLYNVLARHVRLDCDQSGAKNLKVAVVCTKSEEINVTTARRDLCGPAKRVPSSIMNQFDKDIQLAKQRKDRVAEQVLKQKQSLKLIQARNDHVKEGLQDVYAKEIPGAKLQVFCVSNTTYETYAEEGDKSMVQSSGIPELRQFCHRITADAQLREAKHFLQSTLSSLLNSVDIWAQSTSSTPRPDDIHTSDIIYDALQQAQTEALKTFWASRKSFETDFKELFLDLLGRNSVWEREARAKGSAWTTWHWTQYYAWCVNEGAHATPKRRFVNWNAELIWKMRMELDYQWITLEDEIPITFDKMLLGLKTPLLNLGSIAQDMGLSSAIADGVAFRIRDIEYKLRLAEEEFKREAKLIRLKASEPNDTSYILSEMLPAYRSAVQQHGGGTADRIRWIVQGRITNGTLMPNISTAIREDMDNLIEKTFDALRKQGDDVFELIKDDLDMILGSHVQDDDSRRDNEVNDEKREELAIEITRLKIKHREVLASVEELN